jgi:hypothetical protein
MDTRALDVDAYSRQFSPAPDRILLELRGSRDWCVPIEGRNTMTTNIEQGSTPMHNGTHQVSESRSEREPDSMSSERRSGSRELVVDSKENNNAFSWIGDSLRSPTGGATIAGVIGLGAATIFGVVETLVGAGAAYGVYRLVCKRQNNQNQRGR